MTTRRKVILTVLAAAIGLIAYWTTRVREPERRQQSADNLKFIGLAINDYKISHGQFPPWAVRGKDGRPLLSWRVLILPYLREDGHSLFREFRLDEPWDGPHNLRLLERMPAEYAPVTNVKCEPFTTFYQAIVGKGTIFDPDRTVTGADIGGHEGAFRTVLVVEANEAVPWTKPDELTYESYKPLPVLGGLFKGEMGLVDVINLDFDKRPGCHILFAYGGAWFFDRESLDEATLRKMVLRKGRTGD